MTKIKNIIFDLGAVILTDDDNWLYINKTKNLLKVTGDQLNRGWNEAWPLARDGKIDENKFFEIFLKNTGVSGFKSIPKLKEIYRHAVGTLPVFSLLKKLKLKYKIFALTNIAKDWLKYKTRKFDLYRYFDLIVSSCGEKIAKPHKEIFESLINKAKIIPDESLFIDDMERNIKPAQELGFQTILFENKRQLVKQMKKLGVKI